MLQAYAYGHDFAKSSEWFCVNLNCDRRQLQYARKLLEREHPILSDQTGFWLCDNPAEYASVIGQAIKLLKAEKDRIEDLEICLAHRWPTYQPTLWEVA
jgi:hypothetical protein